VETNRLLVARYGKVSKPKRKGGTTGALIAGLMSQNTTDHNRDIAYSRLVERFPKWGDVAKADENCISEAIRPAGMMNQRAPRIKALLADIHARAGSYSADFLLKMPHKEAFQWLIERDGIGEKTAAVFLLFYAGAPYFPVDTHIKRVLPRLGWFPEKTPALKIQRRMTKLCPPEVMMNLHMNIIRLGRKICKPKNPRCSECPLKKLCNWGRKS